MPVKRFFYPIAVLTLFSCAVKPSVPSSPQKVSVNKTETPSGEIFKPKPQREISKVSPRRASNESASAKAGAVEKKQPPLGKEKVPSEGLLLEVARLAILKGGTAVKRENGFLLEAFPKGEKNNCKRVVVRVKEGTSKGEKDFEVLLCGNGTEVNPI